ncbi:MAG: SBBP repeat-containing protein [Acidobacteriota bacterium]|nr:SBBP repeat-containing protein [Acidobacteriota bacterium]
MTYPKSQHTALFLAVLVLTVAAGPTHSFALFSQPRSLNEVAQGAYLDLPLGFEENVGQAIPAFKYITRGAGFSMMFAPRTTLMNLRLGNTNRFVAIDWLNSQDGDLAGEESLGNSVSYIKGSDLKQWRSNIPIFRKLRYSELYKGIDLVFYGNHRALEYDLVINSGSPVAQIKQHLRGVASLELSKDGDLVMKVGTSELRQHRPVAYQIIGEARREVAASFVIHKNNIVGFKVGNYDPKYQLVIDPSLVYSTYIGGGNSDLPASIAVDKSGHAYITGTTNSLNYPVKNAFQPVLHGNSDAFVTKFSTTGSGLIYSTYVGGNADESGNSIVVDQNDQAYVVGATASTDFPGKKLGTVNGPSAFAFKLNSAGNALIYSVRFGGSNTASAKSGALNSNGQLYITGETTSPDFPTTTGAFQSHKGSDPSAFVAKLNSSATAFMYSTFLGGSAESHGEAIAVDGAGSAYVGGFAFGNGYPTTSGAFQKTAPSKNVTCQAGETPGACGPGAPPTAYSGFVTKLSSNGSGLVYSTYLAGNQVDQIYGIKVDTAGRAYVTGQTSSPNFPVTASAFQRSKYHGTFDAFVTKLWATGGGLIFSTYLGGSGDDAGMSIALDGSTNVYVVGATTSVNFPSKSAVQTRYGGGGDAFLTSLTSTGSTLRYSTYLGGENADVGAALALDANGNAFISGNTSSRKFPLKNAFQPSLKGAQNGFVVKVGP